MQRLPLISSHIQDAKEFIENALTSINKAYDLAYTENLDGCYEEIILSIKISLPDLLMAKRNMELTSIISLSKSI